MRVLCSVLFCLFMLVSCSGQSPSKAKFNLNIQGLTSTQGGLVIYGHGLKGRFARVIMTSSGAGTIEEDIPQGTWSFGAVAWDGAYGFAGDIICGFANDVEVSGTSVPVNLNLHNDNCFSNALPNTFTGTSPNRSFKVPNPNLCQGDVSGRTSTPCTYGPMIRPVVRGFAGSYKLFVGAGRYFKENTTDLSASEHLESRCYNIASNSEPGGISYDATELNLPAFDPALKFPVQVVAYLGENCEEGKGVIRKSLADPREAKIHNLDSGNNLLHISASINEVCTVSENLITANTSSPAAGNGTQNSPWLICSEEQLRSIQQNFLTTALNTAFNNGIYVLGRDMNLLKFMQIADGSCLRPGSTFTPIGLSFNSFPGCTMNNLSFGSNFAIDGNGHTISYFRFQKSDEPYVGFMGGNLFIGDIYDVNFDRAEVEGEDHTGIVAGQTSGSIVKMVRVTNSRVDGDQFAGGIIGRDQGTSTLLKLFGHNLHVEGSTSTGGLIGHVNSANLNDVYFNGSVYAESGSQFIGGIAGRVNGNITSAVAEGLVQSSGTRMGGIAGQANYVKYARSEVLINDFSGTTSSALEIGGIVGFHGPTFNVTHSLFMGKIHTNCNSGACEIGAISGVGDTPPSDVFTTWDRGLADGYNGDDVTYNLNTIFGAGADSAICGVDASCTFDQPLGDKPRITTVETGPNTPACSLPVNVQTLGVQSGPPYNRGGSMNPLVICNPSQFADIVNFAGAHFILRDHINLSDFTTLPLGNFDGHLDGKDHYAYGIDIETTGSVALFDTIVDGTVSNLILAGTKIESTACTGSCDLASFALTNDGTLRNVRAEEVSISTSTDNTRTGGLVTTNNDTLNFVNVFGNIRSQKSVGGIAYQNYGTISGSSSSMRLEGQGAASNTGEIGGVVSQNHSIIQRTSFNGIIDDIANAVNVGGIIASSNAGSVLDNVEFSAEAEISIDVTTSNVGGFAGASDSGTVIRRSLSRGNIYSSGTAVSASAFVGNGSFTTVADGLNYKMTVPQRPLEAFMTASGHVFSSATNLCTFDLTITTGNSGGVDVPGMILANGKYYHGVLDDLTSNYTFETITRDINECASITSASVYKAISETPDVISVAQLKNPLGLYKWNIANFGVTTERADVFKSYIEILSGKFPSNPPVWIYDKMDGGLKLFSPH